LPEENKSSEEIYVRYDGRVEKKMDYNFHLFPSVIDTIIICLEGALAEVKKIETKVDPLISLQRQNISEFIDDYYRILKERENDSS